MEVIFEMRPIFVKNYLIILKLVLGEGIRLNPEICYLGLPWCLWLRYGCGLEMSPIFVRKHLNNNKITIG